MTPLMQSEIFFFISSIGFVVVAIIAIVVLAYLGKAVKAFTKLTEKVEGNIDTVGEAAQDVIEDMRSSAVYRLITMRGKKQRISSKKD